MIVASLLLLVFSALLLAISVTTLAVSTYAWWDPGYRLKTSYPPADGEEDAFGFSLIMPCRHESETLMRATLERLLAQSHSDVEIILSVGHDDPATIAIARLLAAEHPSAVMVSVDTSAVENKPRQLNAALPLCTKEIVGVFDAESIAATDLLKNIDGTFRASGADAVQGAVQLVNYRDSWYSLRGCLEYFIWFRSRLHAQAKLGFIPLGGNTVFVRRALLDEIGGWDANCLAEDCELGVRLSTLHRRIVVAYSPELVTREETPSSISSLVKQRTRWSLGFMQVYSKGLWRQLPTVRERATAWWTLTQQHLIALTGIAVPLSIALAIWGSFPLFVTMFAFLPGITTLTMVAIELCMLQEFGRDRGFTIRVRDYLRLVVSTPAYQLVLAFSAIRAYFRFVSRDFSWEKTDHAGTHLRYIEAEPVQ